MRDNPLIFSSENTSEKYSSCTHYLRWATMSSEDAENYSILTSRDYAILGLNELSQLKSMVPKRAYSPYRLNGMERIFRAIIKEHISWLSHNSNFSLAFH